MEEQGLQHDHQLRGVLSHFISLSIFGEHSHPLAKIKTKYISESFPRVSITQSPLHPLDTICQSLCQISIEPDLRLSPSRLSGK